MSEVRDPAELALEALNEAALTIASQLDLENVLQQIVNSARNLVGSRFAALGVPRPDGSLSKFVYSGLTADEANAIPMLPQGKGLLGAIVRQKKPLRVSRIEDHELAAGMPPGHPPMTTFLGVPVMAGDHSLGNLYLTDKVDGTEFTSSDQRLVEMLAAHAAIAIQNARLYEQVERLAVLEERTRIGMDLHDGVIQSIYAVGLTLESTRLVLSPEDTEAHDLITVALKGLDEAIRDIRNFILDLRPRRFSGDLSQGIAQLVREFQANTMVPVTLTVDSPLEGLPTTVARSIFLTTQEALANIARHARASAVSMTLDQVDSVIELRIADDGRGFIVGELSNRVGHGLPNMQARAESLGGSFRVEAAPGHGTALILDFPV